MSQEDSQATSQEDPVQPLPPRQALWQEIEAWAKAFGKRPLMELLQSLDASMDYQVWLATELGQPLDKEPNAFESTAEATGDLPLVKLSADPSRQHGYRVVTHAGLLKKMRDLCIAGEWRSWDCVVLCHIVAATEQPPAKKPRTAQASAASAEGTSLVYVDFHHRGCALHALCALHHHKGISLPEWLTQMANRMPFQWRGQMTRTQLVAEGLGTGISMQEGVVKQSWLDLVLEIIENRTDADTLQETVEKLCPEHAASIANWQHLKDLTTRVHSDVYCCIAEFMTDHDMSVPPLPMAWLREPWMLLAGRKSREFCTEKEQRLVVHRVLAQLLQLADEELSMQQQLTSLWRRKEVDVAQRRNFVRLCKKYIVGMEAAAAANKVPDYSSLEPRFIKGEFDGAVHATSNPQTSAKYWPWVKEAQASQEDNNRKEQQAQLSEQAAAAQQEAELLVQEAEKEREGYAALDDSIAAKMEGAYRKTLSAHALSLSKVAKDAGSLAEELWVKHQDAEQQKRLELQAEGCLWTLVDSRRDGNMLCGKQLAAWITTAPSGKPLLFFLDIAYGEFSPLDLKVALSRAGLAGAVVVIMSDPAGAAGLVHKEHDLLQEITIRQVAIFRIFLQWKSEGQGWLLILANMPASGTVEGGSALLARLCKSPAVSAGALLGLSPLQDAERKVNKFRQTVLQVQRGRDFYSRVLAETGIMTQLMLHGMEAPDFTFVEPDAGVGECLDLLATAHRKKKIPKEVVWIGGVTSGPNKRSAAACHDIVKEVVKQHHDAMMQAVDTTIPMDPRYFHCVEQVPAVPEPPQLLRDRLAKHLLQPSLRDPVFLNNVMDVSTVEVLQSPQERTFRQCCPAKLALAMECSEQHVVVGRSFLGQTALGLYPTKDFNPGDIIVFGHSIPGVWVDEEEVPLSMQVSRCVALELVSCFRKPKVMCCLGNADRHAWANMNSSHGTGTIANVIPECIPGPMHDSFLVFKAAVAIKAMEGELLWNFQCRKKEAGGTTDAAASGAANAPAAPPPASAAASSAAAPAPPPAPAASAAASSAASSAAAPAPPPTPAASAAASSAATREEEEEEEEDNFFGGAEGPAGGGAVPQEEEEAEKEETGGEELTDNQVLQMGTFLTELEDISGNAYVYRKGLHVVFEQPGKVIPKHTILLDIDGGSILKAQEWNIVPYNPSVKTTVHVNGEFGAMHEFCGKMVQSVWGRQFAITGKGVGVTITPQKSQGKVVELYWTPPPETNKKLVETLLALEGMEFIYKFTFSPEEGGMQMTPAGLVIRTGKKISQKSKTTMMSVYPVKKETA